MTRYYFFDVDGTLTAFRQGSTGPFTRQLLPGVAEKCARLRAEGCVLALVSNQGGARKGKPGRLTVGAVMAHLRWVAREIGAARIKFAVSSDRKKPAPAMIVELLSEFDASPSQVVFVGDADSDRQAAEAAGVRFEWVTEFFRHQHRKDI